MIRLTVKKHKLTQSAFRLIERKGTKFCLFRLHSGLDTGTKETKSPRHSIVNVPNGLTIGRILATPYISHLVTLGDYKSAIGLLMVAGVSDWLDGHLAKKWNQRTVIGSFIDPLADKLLVGSLSLTMASQGLLPVPLVILMLGRDLGLVMGTLLHRYRSKESSAPFFNTTDFGSFEIKPSNISKANTLLQLSLLGLTLTQGAWNLPGSALLYGLQTAVAASTLVSGYDYATRYRVKGGAFGIIGSLRLAGKDLGLSILAAWLSSFLILH